MSLLDILIWVVVFAPTVAVYYLHFKYKRTTQKESDVVCAEIRGLRSSMDEVQDRYMGMRDLVRKVYEQETTKPERSKYKTLEPDDLWNQWFKVFSNLDDSRSSPPSCRSEYKDLGQGLLYGRFHSNAMGTFIVVARALNLSRVIQQHIEDTQ